MTSSDSPESLAPKPVFMSEQHVQIMNRLLADDPLCREEAAKLDRAYVLAYRLAGGPAGQTVWWQMCFDPAGGIRFELREPPQPADLTLQGDWSAMMRTMREVKEGRPAENPLTAVGNEKMMEKVAAAFAAGQKAATIATEIPVV